MFLTVCLIVSLYTVRRRHASAFLAFLAFVTLFMYYVGPYVAHAIRKTSTVKRTREMRSTVPTELAIVSKTLWFTIICSSSTVPFHQHFFFLQNCLDIFEHCET